MNNIIFEDFVRKLENLSSSCHTGTPCDPIPVQEIDAKELASTMFVCELPEKTGYYSLPLLNVDGTRVGGFGYVSAIVDIYRDGTAIARTREWKNGYRPNEPTPDGKNRYCSKNENHMTARFYLLGCKHEYEERPDLAKEQGITLYSHDHYNSCKKCGHWFVVDSSD
jgi:hypothetical protein